MTDEQYNAQFKRKAATITSPLAPDVIKTPEKKQSGPILNVDVPKTQGTKSYLGGVVRSATQSESPNNVVPFRLEAPKITVKSTNGILNGMGTVMNILTSAVAGAVNKMSDLYDFTQPINPLNPTKVVPVIPSKNTTLPAKNTKDYAIKTGAKAVSAGTALAGAAFAPVSAELSFAEESNIPVISQVAKLANAGFGALDTAGRSIVGYGLDTLKQKGVITQETYDLYSEPGKELGGLAFTLGMLHGLSPALQKAGFRDSGAKNDLGETLYVPREGVAPKIARGVGAVVPYAFSPATKMIMEPMAKLTGKVGDKIFDRKAKGEDVNNPDVAREIMNEAAKEVPIELPGVMTIHKVNEKGEITGDKVELHTNYKTVLQNLIPGMEDLNWKKVDGLGTDANGNAITARYEPVIKNGKVVGGTVYYTRESVGSDLLHEIGHHFDRKLSSEIGIKLSDIIPDYIGNKEAVDASLAGYAIKKLGNDATKEGIDAEVKKLVDDFKKSVEELGGKGEDRSFGEKFANAIRAVLKNPEDARTKASDFVSFIEYQMGQESGPFARKVRSVAGQEKINVDAKVIDTRKSELAAVEEKIKTDPALALTKFARVLTQFARGEKIDAESAKRITTETSFKSLQAASDAYQNLNMLRGERDGLKQEIKDMSVKAKAGNEDIKKAKQEEVIQEKITRMQFISPNEKENLTYDQAEHNMKTKTYENKLKKTEKVYAEDGIEGKLEKGMGDWADGAEQTFIKKITNEVDDATAIYSLAKSGKEFNQKDVIDFKFEVKGKDELYTIDPKGKNMREMKDILDKAGIQFKTLGEKELYVVNSGEYFDKTMVDKMKKLEYDNGIKVSMEHGTATFVTKVEDRAEARKIYDKIIKDYGNRQTNGTQTDTVRKSVPGGKDKTGGKPTGGESAGTGTGTKTTGTGTSAAGVKITQKIVEQKTDEGAKFILQTITDGKVTSKQTFSTRAEAESEVVGSTKTAGVKIDQVLYHGTNKKVEGELKPSTDESVSFGKGIYLTSDKNIAKEYGKNVIEVSPQKELKLKTITDSQRQDIVELFGKQQENYIKKIIGDEYDGIRVPSKYGSGEQIVVYKPEALKRNEVSKNVKKPEPKIQFSGKEIVTKAFNENKINAPEDVMKVLDEAAAKNNQFSADRRSATQDEIQEFALKFLGDKKAIKDVPDSIRKNVVLLRAAEQTMVDIAQDIIDTNKKIDPINAKDTDVAEIRNKMLQLETVMQSVAGGRTEAGRLLSSLKREMTPGENNIMRELINAMKETGIDTTNAENFFKIRSKAKDKMYETKAEALVGTWYSFLLSGPTTFIKNAISTAGNVIGETISNAEVGPRGFANQFIALRDGLVEGYTKAKLIAKGELESETRSSQKLGTGSDKIPYEFTGKLGLLNHMRVVGRLLSASDTIFYEGLKGMEEVGQKYNPLSKSELIDLGIKRAKKEGYSDVEAQMMGRQYAEKTPELLVGDSASAFALRGTYNSKPVGVLGGLSESISHASQKYPILKTVVPFTRVVANVTNAGIDWTPYGLTRIKTGEGLFGNIGSKARNETNIRTLREQKQQAARAITGTLFMGLAGILATQGRLSGNGPSDFDKKQQLLDSGWRPNSIKLGNTWIPIVNLGAPMVPLLLVANSIDAAKYSGAKEEDVIRRFTAGVTGMGATIFGMSFLTSLNGLMDAFSANNPNKLERFISNTLTSPVPNFYKQVMRIMDPTVYETNNLQEVIQSNLRITGGLKPKLNMFGEVVEGDRFTQLEPQALSKDPVKRYLADNQLWIPVPGKTTQVKDRSVEGYKRTMTPDEYYDYVKISGGLIKEQLTDRIEFLKSIDDKERAQKVINEIVSGARERAKGEIQREINSK